jgi:hypothetical protein
MTDDKRAELVKFLLENGHGWNTSFSNVPVHLMEPHHRKVFMDTYMSDPYYIKQYDVLSNAWIVRLSPLAVKELEDGS